MPTSLERIAHELAQGLAAVHVLLAGDNGPAVILRSLGWDLPPGAEDVGLAALDFSDLVDKVLELEDDIGAGKSGPELDAEFAELLVELGKALVHVQAAVEGLSAAGDYLDKTQIKDEFFPRLTSVALTSRLAAASPFALLVMQATGVVTVEQFAADPTIFQVDHVRPTIHYDALGRLFTDPVGQIESRYGWGTADFDGDALIGNLSALVEVLGIPVRRRALPRRVEEQLRGSPVPEADTDPVSQLIASLVRGHEASGLDVGVSLYPLRATTAGGADGGLGVSPFVHGTTDLHFPLTDVLSAEFQANLGLDSGVALELRPNVPTTIKAGLLDPGGVVDAAAGKVLLLLTFADPDGGDVTLLTLPGGGIVEAKSLAVGGGVDVAHAGITPAFAARLTGGHAVLRMDDADSFLASILPRDGVEAHFDVGLRWSGAEGFSFEGSAQAGTDLPVHLAIAGFRIDYLHVGLGASPAGVPLELSVTGGGTLGPLSASVERLGTIATLAFHDGNLGPVDLAFAFKAPTGVGLSIDAGIVAAAGSSRSTRTAASTRARSQLVLADFLTVGAIGLITTKLPDGSPGFSLLIIITADFGTGIQLGFGFTLLAVGGLIGLNRTMLLQPLTDGVRTGAIDSVMFPRDVIANAPRIISDLRTFFPPQQGTFLIGPMAKLGWGEPTLISLSLGVIIEIPPGDVAILGSAQGRAAGGGRRAARAAGELRRRARVRQAALLLLRVALRLARPVHHDRGRDGRAVRVRRRRQLRAVGRRLPPEVQPAAAAVPDAEADPARHHQRVVRADPRRGLLRRHHQHGPVRHACGVLLRLLGAVGQRPLELRRADPVLAVPLHRRDLDVVLREGLRPRRLRRRHRPDARGPDAVARARTASLSFFFFSIGIGDRLHLGRRPGHHAAAGRGDADPGRRARQAEQLARRPPQRLEPARLAAQARSGGGAVRAAPGRHAAGQPARRAARPRARQGRQPEAERREPVHARRQLRRPREDARSPGAVRARRSSRTSTTPTKLSQPAYVPQDSGVELSADGRRTRRRPRSRATSATT